MELSASERLVLQRFLEKCRMAGGARAGFNLRRRAVGWGRAATADGELDEALSSLVAKGLLKPNEGGDRFSLTQAGCERLAAGLDS